MQLLNHLLVYLRKNQKLNKVKLEKLSNMMASFCIFCHFVLDVFGGICYHKHARNFLHTLGWFDMVPNKESSGKSG